MPRRRDIQQRIPLPDPRYNDVTVAMFINAIMLCGKKGKAQHIFYAALEHAYKTAKKESTVSVDAAVKFLKDILDRIRPLVEVKSRRVGGATYQIPIEVSAERGCKLSMRWLIEAARNRGGAMAESLARELMDASNGVGTALKKREDTHRMAEANKAFAHFTR